MNPTPVQIRQAIVNLLTPKTLILLMLGGIAFFMSLLLIYVKDQYRQHFIQLETLKAEHNRLETEWSELLLEESTWSSRTRVSHLAQNKLGMIPIQASDIRMLTPEQIQADSD
jgi:cell division protein FtsL